MEITVSARVHVGIGLPWLVIEVNGLAKDVILFCKVLKMLDIYLD